MNSAHSHHCAKCDITWHHSAQRARQMDTDEFDAIHSCPGCGTIVTAYYYGLEPPRKSNAKPFVFEDHSSLVNAEQAEYAALNFPVPYKADFEALADWLEQTHATLRRVFAGGQTPGVPDDWKIDGTAFQYWDARLSKAMDTLVLRHRATKFFAGLRRHEREQEKEKQNLTPWIDLDDEKQYWVMKFRGFDVRVLRIGRKTVYQYASRHETSRPKADAITNAKNIGLPGA